MRRPLLHLRVVSDRALSLQDWFDRSRRNSREPPPVPVEAARRPFLPQHLRPCSYRTACGRDGLSDISVPAIRSLYAEERSRLLNASLTAVLAIGQTCVGKRSYSDPSELHTKHRLSRCGPPLRDCSSSATAAGCPSAEPADRLVATDTLGPLHGGPSRGSLVVSVQRPTGGYRDPRDIGLSARGEGSVALGHPGGSVTRLGIACRVGLRASELSDPSTADRGLGGGCESAPFPGGA